MQRHKRLLRYALIQVALYISAEVYFNGLHFAPWHMHAIGRFS